MAPSSSNPETKKEPFLASDPSCMGKSGSSPTGSHQFYDHEDKCVHLGGHCRCSHTGHVESVPDNLERSLIEASPDVSNGHGCSSNFENGGALCGHRNYFSECPNDACDEGFATIGSWSDDVGLHVGHERYTNALSKRLRRLSIRGGHEAISHSKARPFGFDEMLQKSRTGDDDVFVSACLCTKNTFDVDGTLEMVQRLGNGDNTDTEVQLSIGDPHKGASAFTTKNCDNTSDDVCSSTCLCIDNTSDANGTQKMDNSDAEVQHCNGDPHKGAAALTTKNCAKKVFPINNSRSQRVLEAIAQSSVKRPFCRQCEKVQELCICVRIKGVVQNKVKVTILQNPKEKRHAVGSARVALLGLKNVALIDVPEIVTKESFRIRPKVPGSKRCLAGRGGKKLLLMGGKAPHVPQHTVPKTEAEVVQIQNLLTEIFGSEEGDRLNGCESSATACSEHNEAEIAQLDEWHDRQSRQSEESKGDVSCRGQLNKDHRLSDKGSTCLEDWDSLIPRGVALLYPSDKAIELSASALNLASLDEEGVDGPRHLLVLDGTWSKARRIYFENPWLHGMRHYKLVPAAPSLYEGVRKQPKPGCLSTLESIVYALRLLEPDTEGLDGLLEVFDSMVEDQRRCKRMKGLAPEREI